MLITHPYPQSLTLKEAASLLGCRSTPLGQEARIRLMLGTLEVRAFSPVDVRHILGNNYADRLTASSVSWRNALTSLTGIQGSQKTKQVPFYRVVIDVDALQAIISGAQPVPVEGNYHVKRTGAHTVRPQ